MIAHRFRTCITILCLTSLLLLIGCSKSASDDDSAPTPTPPDNSIQADNLPPEGSVEGVWSTTCFFNEAPDANSFQTNTYIRREERTFYSTRSFEAAGCQGAFFKEILVVGTTEDVGTVVDPIFGVTATSVLVNVSSILENASASDVTPEPFFDLVYRSGSTLALGLRGREDPATNVPTNLNWTLTYQYVDLD